MERIKFTRRNHVVHRRSGLVLGLVVHWNADGWDCGWFPYRADAEGRFEDETCCQFTHMSRIEAGLCLLDPGMFRPPDHLGKAPNGRLRPAEEESRAAFPTEWAWYDRVRAAIEEDR